MGISRHLLALDFPATADCGIFRIKDISVYSSALAISCPTLQITPPGYTEPFLYTPSAEGFDLVLNACGIGITDDCSDINPEITDGIYHIRYSVSPHDKVYVEYKVCRTVALTNRLARVMGSLNMRGYGPDSEVSADIRELMFIQGLIQSGTYMIQDLERFTDGMSTINYAAKRLNKFSCTSC